MLSRSLGAKCIVAWTALLVICSAVLLWDIRGKADGIHSMRVVGRSQSLSGGGRNGPPMLNWNVRFRLDDGRTYDAPVPDGSWESSVLTIGTKWKATVWKCRLHDAVCRISDAVEQRHD